MRTFVGRHGGGWRTGKLSEAVLKGSGRGSPLRSVAPLKLLAFVVQV